MTKKSYEIAKEKIVEYFQEKYNSGDYTNLICIADVIYEKLCCYDCIMYGMEDIDDVVMFPSILDFAPMILNGNFNPKDKFFRFDDDGNLVSMTQSDVLNLTIADEVLEYILDERYDYGYSELKNIIDDYYNNFDDEEVKKATTTSLSLE